MKHATIITLGCSKNLVDSERVGASLFRAGWEVSFDEQPVTDDVLLLNTCGFIGDAKEESIAQILTAGQLREQGVIRELVVFGCLSQRYGDELRAEIPEVDAWFGVDDWERLLRHLGCELGFEFRSSRLLSTPQHYAYLKIAEGCDRGCAFCAIPSIRGGFHSESVENLMGEAKSLTDMGVKELILVAQELTYYGRDLRRNDLLLELLEQLANLESLEWIRLHYAYPANFPMELVAWLARESKACRYLDIPIQHISDSILRSMRRPHDAAYVRELVAELRARVPSLALRTTLLVGYPGETERDFALLADFVREARFEHLGVFTYSEEEGTYAAAHFSDDVPQAEKEERRDYLMRIQREVSAEWRAGFVGRTLPCIVDERLDEYSFLGRTEYDSPEVDGEVLIRAPRGGVHVGEVVQVCITGSSEYDLSGDAE